MDEQQQAAQRGSRRRSRRDFGTVVDLGTPTNPSFMIRWREAGRKRARRGFTSRREAQEELARIRVRLTKGEPDPKRQVAATFSAVGKEWLRLHSLPNLRSHPENQRRFDRYLAPFFGDVPVAKVTALRILELRTYLQSKVKPKLAPRTINQNLQELRAILKFAVVADYIPAAPTDAIGRGKLMVEVPKRKREPPIAKREDVGRFLAVLREGWPRLYAMFATAAYCGLRKGELCGLRWRDVDLKRRMIIVRRSYTDTPKSGKEREVPIPPELVPILADHRLRCPHKGELVFPNDAGEMMTRNVRLHEVLQAALTRAELPPVNMRESRNFLRHTFASHFVMAGGSVFDLQKTLGHSSVQITAEEYSHLSADHRIREAARVSFPEPDGGKVVQMGAGGDAA